VFFQQTTEQKLPVGVVGASVRLAQVYDVESESGRLNFLS
jgi:hypothetical protein